MRKGEAMIVISMHHVEDCLSRDNMMPDLLECQKRLLCSVTSHDDQISALAYKRVRTSSIDHDISELIIQVTKNERKTNEELLSAIQQINLQIEMAERINICFEISKLIYPLGHAICFDLLKERCSWDYIIEKHHVSRGNIALYKKKELRLILILICLYEPKVDLLQKWNNRLYGVKKSNPKINLNKILEEPELVVLPEEIRKVTFKNL